MFEMSMSEPHRTTYGAKHQSSIAHGWFVPIYRARKALDAEKREIVGDHVNIKISWISRHFFWYLSNVGKVVPFREFTTIPCIPWLDSHLRDTQSLDRRTVEWLSAVDGSEMWPDGVGSPILHVFTHLAWQNRHVWAPQYHSWGYTAVGYSVRMIRTNL